MTKRDPAILRAERLRAVMAMPEYKSTIGAWLEEAESAALHDMTTAKEPCEFHGAQGAYKAIKAFVEQFDRVFAAETAAINKLAKRKTDDHSSGE